MLQQALKHNREAEVLIIPTKQNPLKESRGAEMALIQAWLEDLGDELSYQEFSRIRLETYEMFSSEEQNYTINTLKELNSGSEHWALLLGSDAASKFNKWKSPEEILGLIDELWVVPRGDDGNEKITQIIHAVESSTKSKVKITFLEKVKDISSTQIRNLSEKSDFNDEASSQPLNEFLSTRVLSVWKQLLAC